MRQKRHERKTKQRRRLGRDIRFGRAPQKVVVTLVPKGFAEAAGFRVVDYSETTDFERTMFLAGNSFGKRGNLELIGAKLSQDSPGVTE